ncbi:carbohydrate ABC transporter permease [Dictyobacter arantiisoli]|uniref:Alpha-glucoside ABC transporter permease n=1 Tax=Dictyobacter arantiisoli TaxID=2014874 RepID=A0A5A5TDB0_9CHLR|nr:sugar ABC transporter permease [Dictyobacter arantiisoli]GCF09520.1 alpha-glucoside ABC transporter permease [Dictyobacter arantiisoli]
MTTTDYQTVSIVPKAHKARKEHGQTWWAWVWVAPALILELIFYIYPLIQTIILSFQNADSSSYVGFKNYVTIFTNPTMLEVIKNNLLWLVLATLLTVGLGLIVAVLVDKVRVESVVKSALFVPMAISFVAAGVIWRFIYLYSPNGENQIGLLNAFLGLFKVQPQAWLINTSFNNLALIAVYTWMWTGFCMVIISAALKGIPEDVIEAAKIDGASNLTLFWRITVPMVQPTLGVVATTMVINVLKIFDVIYIMTGGDYKTDVVAVEFYNQLFNFSNYGLASALAILLLIVISPVMYINIRRLRAQEAER